MKLFALILISLLSIPNSKSIVETINLNEVRKSNSAFTTVSNSYNNTTFKPKGFYELQQSEIIQQSNYAASNMVCYNTKRKTISFEHFSTSKSAPNESKESFVSENVETPLLIDNDTNSFAKGISEISNPKSWPYLATVKVIAEYNYIYNYDLNIYETRRSLGTGFLLGKTLLMTAGHIVYTDMTSSYEDSTGNTVTKYDDGIYNPSFPDSIKIFAGLNGTNEEHTPYLYYSEAIEIHIRKNYFENPSFNHDWAAIELDRDLGSITGTYGYIAEWTPVYTSGYLYGYHANHNSKMCYSDGTFYFRLANQYYYSITGGAGASGAPLFMTDSNGNAYVCGIHTWEDNTMYGGTVFTNFIYDYIHDFVTNHNAVNMVAQIDQTDYGYQDFYTTNYYDYTIFRTHTLDSGFQFQTKRYRTGYIHNEYVVLSPIRIDISSAYLIYKFNTPINKVRIELSHWRELSHEWTYSYNVTCNILCDSESVSNLLSNEINLTVNRNSPTTFTFIFPYPTTTFEISMENQVSFSNNDNRGRLCIGNVWLYS